MKEIKSVSEINNRGGDSSLKRIGNFIKEARLSRNQSIEELVEEVSKKNYKSRQYKKFNPVGFLIFILISGFLGLIASSLIFNLFSDSSENQTPKQELLKKTK